MLVLSHSQGRENIFRSYLPHGCPCGHFYVKDLILSEGYYRNDYSHLPGYPTRPVPPPTPNLSMPVIGHPRPVVLPGHATSTFIPPPRFFEGKAHEQMHAKGEYPCARCTSGHHADCKPTIYDTLCTCSCEIATKMREHYAFEKERAEDSGLPIPSVWDVATEDLDSIFVARKKIDGKTVSRQLRRPKATEFEELIPIRSASAKLKIPREQLEEMARAHQIPAHFKQGRWGFYRSELDTWMLKVATA